LPTINFKLAGKEDSGIDKQSKEALEKLKKLENVELVGFIKRDMIEEFLSSAYCLLNTSHFEGFSNTFLEAWSIGTPVITSENVNPDNLITDNDLGLVGKNYSDIPIILNKYINQKEYDSLGINCFEYVKEKHNPRYLAEEFINFISN
jgi:glycosyltransferase involved in cell wall biosynthesis